MGREAVKYLSGPDITLPVNNVEDPRLHVSQLASQIYLTTRTLTAAAAAAAGGEINGSGGGGGGW